MRQTWEDIVEDFLEVACRMTRGQREAAIESIRKLSPSSHHLEIHPAFSLEGQLMVILKETDIHHCSLYFVNKEKIEAIALEKPLYR